MGKSGTVLKVVVRAFASSSPRSASWLCCIVVWWGKTHLVRCSSSVHLNCAVSALPPVCPDGGTYRRPTASDSQEKVGSLARTFCCRSAHSIRGAISSEPMSNATTARPMSPKAPELLRHLEQALSAHLMFKHLEGDERLEVFQRMFECHFKAGDIIIKQGDPGDNFYVVETGECDIFVAKNGANTHVLTARPGASFVASSYAPHADAGDTFGELALMYGSPRAATVVAKTDVKLWALDRDTYRHTLMSATLRKRAQYEAFLEKVPILCTRFIDLGAPLIARSAVHQVREGHDSRCTGSGDVP